MRQFCCQIQLVCSPCGLPPSPVVSRVHCEQTHAQADYDDLCAADVVVCSLEYLLSGKRHTVHLQSAAALRLALPPCRTQSPLLGVTPARVPSAAWLALLAPCADSRPHRCIDCSLRHFRFRDAPNVPGSQLCSWFAVSFRSFCAGDYNLRRIGKPAVSAGDVAIRECVVAISLLAVRLGTVHIAPDRCPMWLISACRVLHAPDQLALCLLHLPSFAIVDPNPPPQCAFGYRSWNHSLLLCLAVPLPRNHLHSVNWRRLVLDECHTAIKLGNNCAVLLCLRCMKQSSWPVCVAPVAPPLCSPRGFSDLSLLMALCAHRRRDRRIQRAHLSPVSFLNRSFV
jgi:hypothetical protein